MAAWRRKAAKEAMDGISSDESYEDQREKQAVPWFLLPSGGHGCGAELAIRFFRCLFGSSHEAQV